MWKWLLSLKRAHDDKSDVCERQYTLFDLRLHELIENKL